MKLDIDAAIAAGTQPKAPRNGFGLVLATPTEGLTPAGRHYYDKTGIAPPGRFDYQQDAVRKGRSQYINLLDGSKKNQHVGQCQQGMEADCIG